MLNPNWLERLAAYHPKRRAVFFRDRWLTYGELYERARRAAATLKALGVGPGDRVGLLSWNHPAYLDLLFAAPLLGHILAPFNHRLSLPELLALHAYAAPRVLFYGEGFREAAEALDPRALPLSALLEGEGEPPEGTRPASRTPPCSSSPGGPRACPRGPSSPTASSS